MLFEVKALAPQEFDTWLAGKAASAPPASAAPGASGAPAPSGSAAPAPSGSGAPAPSGGGAGPSLALTASNIQYTEKTLTAPAGTAFQIDFDNEDAGTPHNIQIKDSSGAVKFTGATFNGVATQAYDVPALGAGSYPFQCTVHPSMTGTLTVK
jgi:plastocyanin